MLQPRPRATDVYLERSRLLRQLPDQAGYAVWLQAPYGYGKSVLLSQWANALESFGGRVVWLALGGRSARAALAADVGLPPAVPWPLLLERLEQDVAGIVLEDLEGGEDLGPLLRSLPVPLALASRADLPEPELPRLRAQGRLVHFGPDALAFTELEARRLFADGAGAEDAWRRCGGWPLPLHLAALHGGVTFGDALWAGLRDSLTADDWNELLLLTRVPHLPLAAADERAERLSRLGFVQALASGHRLHPLVADALRAHAPSASLAALRAALPRLPLALRAEACATNGLWSDLADVLEDDRLAVDDSAGVLRWDAACRAHVDRAPGPGRLLGLGWALSSAGRLDEARAAYLSAARAPDAHPEQRLEAWSLLLYDLPAEDHATAAAWLGEAEPWLEQVGAAKQATFHNNASAHAIRAGRWDEAEARLTRALRLAPPQGRDSPESNLAQVRWERDGDLDGYRAQTASSLSTPTLSPFNRAVKLAALGRLDGLLHPENAAAHWQELTTLSAHHPTAALLARAELAALRDDVHAFPALAREAEVWETSGEDVVGPVSALWARAVRRRGDARGALDVVNSSAHPLAAVEGALALGALDRLEEAFARLDAALHASSRYHRLLARAARYRLTRDEADLDLALELTTARERVLPALVPLAELPRARHDLARPYRLRDVLTSGWTAAVTQRAADIPPLELKVLGSVEVRVLGEPVTLASRPRELLLLLAIGRSRFEAAEVLWPGADPHKSHNNLHVNLNALRRALEPWKLPTYLGEHGLTHTRCDLWELRDALRRKDARAVRTSYADLAPGVDLADLEAERSALRERALSLVVTLDADEEAFEWALEHDPLHEEAMHGLLDVLLRSGRLGAARRRYRAYAERLRAELGLEPARTLRSLLAGRPAD